jgi:predicted nuclease of restriction endonuclease-like (RecB) superfamily
MTENFNELQLGKVEFFTASEFFKDVYTLEFLGLPAEHSEADLESALITKGVTA